MAELQPATSQARTAYSGTSNTGNRISLPVALGRHCVFNHLRDVKRLWGWRPRARAPFECPTRRR